MDTQLISRVLLRRHTLRGRERWTQAQVRDHQERQLATLRAFTTARSPFYRRLHHGLDRAPLDELPVLTKTTLMDNYDEISTDPDVRLAALETYLTELHSNERFAGRYWASATSGSSGRRSIIPSDADEWAMTIASYARANEWAGIKSGLTRRVSMAVVSSTTAWHQSSRVAAAVRSPFFVTERMDAASPLPEIVARLNSFQPDVLIGYASMIRSLAHEQLAGRLRVAPRAVNSSSEVLTAESRTLAARAWRVPLFDVYAATETGGIAADCPQHCMHLFEDLVIPEVVDDDYQPVPPGQTGDRLLATVLSSRTIPLIRYELTDRVRLATEPCPCPLPFRVVARIEGRTDDLLVLPTPGGGTVPIHPVVFHQVLELLDAGGWQVRQHEAELRVLIAAPGPGFDPNTTESALHEALTRAGAKPPAISVSVLDAIPAGAAGKRPLVVALPDRADGQHS